MLSVEDSCSGVVLLPTVHQCFVDCGVLFYLLFYSFQAICHSSFLFEPHLFSDLAVALQSQKILLLLKIYSSLTKLYVAAAVKRLNENFSALYFDVRLVVSLSYFLC